MIIDEEIDIVAVSLGKAINKTLDAARKGDDRSCASTSKQLQKGICLKRIANMIVVTSPYAIEYFIWIRVVEIFEHL